MNGIPAGECCREALTAAADELERRRGDSPGLIPAWLRARAVSIAQPPAEPAQDWRPDTTGMSGPAALAAEMAAVPPLPRRCGPIDTDGSRNHCTKCGDVWFDMEDDDA